MLKKISTFFLSHAPKERKNIKSDNKVLQVKADNTSYVFTFPFVLWPTAENTKIDSNSLCYSFFFLTH